MHPAFLSVLLQYQLDHDRYTFGKGLTEVLKLELAPSRRGVEDVEAAMGWRVLPRTPEGWLQGGAVGPGGGLVWQPDDRPFGCVGALRLHADTGEVELQQEPPAADSTPLLCQADVECVFQGGITAAELLVAPRTYTHAVQCGRVALLSPWNWWALTPGPASYTQICG